LEHPRATISLKCALDGCPPWLEGMLDWSVHVPWNASTVPPGT
jgi:hypothetical protein